MQDRSELHSVSVSAAIFDGDRVLIVQRRDNGKWEPPGGVMHRSETLEAALLREVKEETGLDIAIDGLSGVYKNVAAGVVALVFRASPSAGQLTLNDEVTAFRWLTLDEVGEIVHPVFAARLLDAALNKVAVRDHDGERIIQTSEPGVHLEDWSLRDDSGATR